jgi:hypothetical protein
VHSASTCLLYLPRCTCLKKAMSPVVVLVAGRLPPHSTWVSSCQMSPKIFCCFCCLCCRLTLYIPSAVELTRGGFFYPRGDGTYDTIISAQHILKSFADSHEQQLASLKLLLPESTELLQSPAAAAAVGGAARGAVSEQRDSLRDLVNTGLSTDDNVSRQMLRDGRGMEKRWGLGQRAGAARLCVCLLLGWGQSADLCI